MNENLELIRQKCIEANPEITTEEVLICTRDWSAWTYKTMTEDDFVMEPRPIRLADVLLTIRNVKPQTNPEKICLIVPVPPYHLMETECLNKWNLRKDDLNEQSEEVINFLGELLQ